MLEQVCAEIHNYFIKEAHAGSFSIVDGMISLPFLLEGQRFWITGSALNDGVYTYHAEAIMNDDDTDEAGLSDEHFDGVVCAMAIPPVVIALSGEMSNWVDNYGDNVNSPYQSETFNGYSYTKASGRSGGSATVFDVFADRLKPWRTVSL